MLVRIKPAVAYPQMHSEPITAQPYRNKNGRKAIHFKFEQIKTSFHTT
jgi:hypothetical protein